MEKNLERTSDVLERTHIHIHTHVSVVVVGHMARRNLHKSKHKSEFTALEIGSKRYLSCSARDAPSV